MLCLGAGTGLEALVAALCGANALATDVYPFALSLVTEAAALNGVADRVDVAAFDVTRRGAPLPPAEIVLLGDLLYLTDLTAAVAQRVAEARGSVVPPTRAAPTRSSSFAPSRARGRGELRGADAELR